MLSADTLSKICSQKEGENATRKNGYVRRNAKKTQNPKQIKGF